MHSAVLHIARQFYLDLMIRAVGLCPFVRPPPGEHGFSSGFPAWLLLDLDEVLMPGPTLSLESDSNYGSASQSLPGRGWACCSSCLTSAALHVPSQAVASQSSAVPQSPPGATSKSPGRPPLPLDV